MRGDLVAQAATFVQVNATASAESFTGLLAKGLKRNLKLQLLSDHFAEVNEVLREISDVEVLSGEDSLIALRVMSVPSKTLVVSDDFSRFFKVRATTGTTGSLRAFLGGGVCL